MMKVFRRVCSVALAFAMLGVTTVFAATNAYESGHVTVDAGSKSYEIYSILYEDSTNRYRASAWAEVGDHSNVPAQYIGVDAWLCTPRDQILASTGFRYNSTNATFEYACTSSQYTANRVYASGEVDLYTGTKHVYETVPESPYAGGNTRSSNLHEEVAFSVNVHGETYGTVKTAEIVGYKPDLIAAVGNGGVEGYIKMADMRPNITCEADIEAYYEKLETDPQIPLYDVNGNVIGTFTVGGSERADSEATTVAEVKAALAEDNSNQSIDSAKQDLLNTDGTVPTVYHANLVENEEYRAYSNDEYIVKNGMTYGTMKQANIIGEAPDMVSVIATNGIQGWVTLRDFSPVRYMDKHGYSMDEINTYIGSTTSTNELKFIPVYDLEMNIIGEFPTGYSMK